MPRLRSWGIASLCLVATLVVTPARARAHHRHARHVAARHYHSAGEALVVHGFGALGRHARGGDAVSIAMRYLGAGNPTGSRHAWCGDFVNMTERLAGRPGMASGASSASWRSYGHASGPVRGAIAVMRGHVARVVARVGDGVWLISGNWSHRVKVHFARLRQVLAFRTL